MRAKLFSFTATGPVWITSTVTRPPWLCGNAAVWPTLAASQCKDLMPAAILLSVLFSAGLNRVWWVHWLQWSLYWRQPVTILNQKVGHGLVFEWTESEEEPKKITMAVTIKGKTFSGSCLLAWNNTKGPKEAKKRATVDAVAELYGIRYPQE